jgi:hypothetical protein
MSPLRPHRSKRLELMRKGPLRRHRSDLRRQSPILDRPADLAPGAAVRRHLALGGWDSFDRRRAWTASRCRRLPYPCATARRFARASHLRLRYSSRPIHWRSDRYCSPTPTWAIPSLETRSGQAGPRNRSRRSVSASAWRLRSDHSNSRARYPSSIPSRWIIAGGVIADSGRKRHIGAQPVEPRCWNALAQATAATRTSASCRMCCAARCWSSACHESRSGSRRPIICAAVSESL